MLDGDELVAERAHLVERRVEQPGEPRGRLRLCASGDGRLLRKAGLRLGAHLGDVVPGPLDERARQLLVEERDREMVRGQLRIAHAPREFLRAGKRFLGFEGEAIEIHQTLRAGCLSGR
jgi:hypothetical protein